MTTKTQIPPASADPDELFSGMLWTLRRTLSACPELSNEEKMTASTVKSFVGAYDPDELYTKLGGGHGVAAVFEGNSAGPTVLVRCELDALPQESKADIPPPGQEARAKRPQLAHLCGHDGHMTMVSGLAPLLRAEPIERGRVVLLYQPAEETGEGALAVLQDPRFEEIAPDYAIALHNLPGVPLGRVIYRAGTFACASVGMHLRLHGSPSHAAEPEKAVSPVDALCTLFSSLPALSRPHGDDYRLLTVTHARLGTHSFGVTPGHAELGATLRATTTEDLQILREEAERTARKAARQQGLTAEVEWLEEFPATRANPPLVELLQRVCEREGVEAHEAPHPFPWSEDFGHFGGRAACLFFGLGIGEDAPALHQADYHFPDEVILTGVRTFHGLIRELLG